MNFSSDIEKEFYSNENVCRRNPIIIKAGQYVTVVDPNLIDPETESYVKITCRCVYVEESKYIPGRFYYYFIAVKSKNNDLLNKLQDPKFDFLYYKILEWTSPYICNDVSDTFEDDEEENS